MIVSKFDCSCAEVLHPWSTSCSFAALEIFYYVFRRSFKMYGSLYLIAALIRRKKLDYLKKHLIREVLQSTLFLSLNASLFVTSICTLRNVLGHFTVLTSGAIPGAIGSFLALLVERPHRRGLLALYMFNNAVEAVFNMLVSRNIITSISYGEVYMFCSATAVLMFLYREKKLHNPFLNRILWFSLGEGQIVDDTSKIRRFEDIYNVTSFKTILKRIFPTVKAFSIGYIVQAVPGLIRCLFQPRKLPKVLVSKNNFKLGLFFGSFVALFQSAEFVLKLIRKKQDSLNSLIAGAVSGLSILFYRSSTISLYLLTKVAEMLLRNAQIQGILPFIPYAEIIIYTISTAVTFHTCMFEVENVRPSYWKFLNHLTNNRVLPASKTFPHMVYGRS